ncbi:hypothetical protein [Halobacillus sp. A5]|nr:hypothetical protein [Halobacillus sp. A5]
MFELVGTCSVCGKAVYCRDGFLDGIIDEEQMLKCNECEEKESH